MYYKSGFWFFLIKIGLKFDSGRFILIVSTAQWKQNTDQEVGTCMHTHPLTTTHAWCYLRGGIETSFANTGIHTMKTYTQDMRQR